MSNGKEVQKYTGPVMGFEELVETVDEGELHRRIERTTMKAISAVGATKKTAEVTIKLTFAQGAARGTVEMTGQVKAKIPDMPIGASMFFVTERGLTREDPRQIKIEFANQPPRRKATVGDENE